MQYWNDILHTAMLGTGKKAPDAGLQPVAIREAVAKLPVATEPEETFMQMTALAYNFRQCSIESLQVAGVTMAPAATETVPYCTAENMTLLSDILNTGSNSLLKLWLQSCQRNDRIVQPDALPQLLDIAPRQKSLRTLIAAVSGNRGQWLAALNPDWKAIANSTTGTLEEIWQTGTLQQRVEVLQQLRADEPTKALQWLRATWPQEDAATRTELLPVLEERISSADLPFLESLSADKSKKVKDVAARLILLIPESSIIQSYWQVLKESIYLKKEKGFLGLTSKTTLIVELTEDIDETIYKSGIEKLSSNPKSYSDEEWILYQLIYRTPPQWWEAHLQASRESVIALFQKEDRLKKFLPALGLTAALFRNIPWLKNTIAVSSNRLYPSALPLLNDEERDAYALRSIRHSDEMAKGIMPYLPKWPDEVEWSLELTGEAFTQMVKNPWQYNRDFFNQHIHLIPTTFAPQLKNYTPKEEYQRSSWNGVTQHIAHLLQLKKAIQ